MFLRGFLGIEQEAASYVGPTKHLKQALGL